MFKKLWTGELFGNGFGTPSLSQYLGQQRHGQPSGGTDSVSCGRFAADVCAAYQASVRTGTPTPALRALMRQGSPASVIKRITAPTLLTQGEQDSLFPLSQADANARGIAANGTPVKVVWRPGGHDDSTAGTGVSTSQMISWFGAVFGGSVTGRQPFQFAEQGGVLSSQSGRLGEQVRQAVGYPGIDGTPQHSTTVTLTGPAHEISAPAGGTPAAITAVPGLSGILASFGGLTDATAALSAIPSQTAAFLSPALQLQPAHRRLVPAGPERHGAHDDRRHAVRRVARSSRRTARSRCPRSWSPRSTSPGCGPASRGPCGCRSRRSCAPCSRGTASSLTVATTDFAYQLPQDAREYTVALAGELGADRAHRARDGPARRPSAGLAHRRRSRWCSLAIGGVTFEIRRRRRIVKPRPDLAEVPVAIESLVKEYSGGYRAVDDVSFRVERGQVVGLLGPNGAGKTTALRVLVGLITPTAGTVHVFGDPVVPGAPVLARLGAFIEGPGFLPHLSGRENLRLFWAATGRPDAEADFDTALEIAGLGASVDRRVKTYSHGMKQRLGIAQAMLGLPELLVLDEPTNGLDPPQIAEMREVMQRYAETGRTVVVSTHLLAEVEQTCTHVVVMHKGKLVAAGSVAEIAGAGGMQLSVADPARAADVLAAAGITATLVPGAPRARGRLPRPDRRRRMSEREARRGSAATRRGVHDRLAALDPGRPPHVRPAPHAARCGSSSPASSSGAARRSSRCCCWCCRSSSRWRSRSAEARATARRQRAGRRWPPSAGPTSRCSPSSPRSASCSS